ncbi:MAG: ABC-F family ATP-binding cassette domain-containing protein [Candidatus Omnitrophica bacterium]|nr:ABC-F family ATP-binding cassette domain-containing protein [Candidatus Omnitrophota bacterium]
MISINSLTKSFGQRDLFKNISLSINRGEKIGLVGPNGAGKSTFFSIILGHKEASSGIIQINKNTRIGYLPQEASFSSEAVVLSEVTQGDKAIKELKAEKDRLETEGLAGTSHYGEVLHDLEFLGYFNLEHKAKKVLFGLGFKEKDLSRRLKELSGGWQMRTLLAKLLTCPYDILFLDEPMNHLDLAAALWFKDYLLSFNGTFVMISHDKDFLNQVTNYTLVLEQGLITKVKGNYDEYDKLRHQRRNHLIKQLNEQEKKRKQLTEFIHRFHGQPNKASQVRAKKKAIEMMPEIIVPPDRKESIRNFKFPDCPKSGYKVISLSKISKSYSDINVYKDFDFELSRGERAVLVGENGAGKSTLLKILAGVVDIDKGNKNIGHNVNIGYFSQTRLDVLNPQNTVFEEAYNACSGSQSPESIRTLLAAFFFIGDDVEKKVSILSGGEKSRLILAKLLLNPPNFLLLDEPTTHLDVDAVDALIQALSHYQGTLVFISHDIHFVRCVANAVFEVKDKKVTKYPGEFDYYWRRTKGEAGNEDTRLPDSGMTSKDKENRDKPKSQVFLDREARKKRKAHNAKLANMISVLRKEQEALELDKVVKVRILSNPRSYHNKEKIIEYGQTLKSIEKRLKEIELRIKELKDSFQ